MHILSSNTDLKLYNKFLKQYLVTRTVSISQLRHIIHTAIVNFVHKNRSLFIIMIIIKIDNYYSY